MLLSSVQPSCHRCGTTTNSSASPGQFARVFNTLRPLVSDQEVLFELERDKVLVFTPARRVQGKRVVCYDDRYIIKLAAETDGIVVSNDHYKDLVNENHDFKKVIEERLLMYSFVDDR